MSREEIVKYIIDNGVVAVVRTKSPDKLIKIVEAIYEGGIKCIEVTMTVPNALNMITQVRKSASPEILVGVGSVLDSDTAQKAIDAGAQYVVSPIFIKEIIATAHKNNVPVMPGCFTPTEIFNAQQAGADIVKVFPADVLGMSFFKSIKAPMPNLKIMPTGGVTLDNAGDWIKSGACAVGIGSALLDEKAIEENNYSKLTENAKRIINSLNSVDKPKLIFA
ncbi:MAG: bifunctional 4-hydroxy-2-oxoglutarate aldolase/2-dehydro-3-deoxy-phosphogluconate aldolase [Ignavibacteriaceae bacterium]|nr:bifunctional 4-hydroxy-2-oxoglutarate aldolase/2-dehydro-3-deoxy-phosphogluconate aldolase [Ignavibacteriaceae bacterium]